MALQLSGSISINDLKAEFGSSANDIFSYYRGAGIVPDIAANSGVPTSGTISFEDFYGAEASTPVDRDPDNSWWPSVSGASPQDTTTVTVTGINTTINMYHTNAGTGVVSVSINSGGFTTWNAGEGNSIAIDNNDTIQLRFSVFSTQNSSISVFNDPIDDDLLVGVGYNLTK